MHITYDVPNSNGKIILHIQQQNQPNQQHLEGFLDLYREYFIKILQNEKYGIIIVADDCVIKLTNTHLAIHTCPMYTYNRAHILPSGKVKPLTFRWQVILNLKTNRIFENRKLNSRYIIRSQNIYSICDVTLPRVISLIHEYVPTFRFKILKFIKLPRAYGRSKRTQHLWKTFIRNSVANNLDYLSNHIAIHRVSRYLFEFCHDILPYIIPVFLESISKNKSLRAFATPEFSVELTILEVFLDSLQMSSVILRSSQYLECVLEIWKIGSIKTIHDRLTTLGVQIKHKQDKLISENFSRHQMEFANVYKTDSLFVPLTIDQLQKVSKDFHNCVFSYQRKVAEGACNIAAYYENNKPLYCIEYHNYNAQLIQIYGVCNASVPEEIASKFKLCRRNNVKVA